MLNSQVLSIIQVVLSAVLVGLILLQQKGNSLGSAWGGSGSYYTKRGAEKIILISTIVVSFLFLSTSIIALLLR